MIKLIQAIMFVKEHKRQAIKYFTNFTKADLNIYLKIKCQINTVFYLLKKTGR